MNHSPPPTRNNAERSLRGICAFAFGSLAIGWVIGVGLVGLVLWQLDSTTQDKDSLWLDALLIALASGAIASVAMLPGLLASVGTQADLRPDLKQTRAVAADRWSGISAAVMAGTAIRAIGTVALFLTCRYHMASTTEMIVAMTISWYVLLTSIEVIVLGRVLPDVARRSGHLVAPRPLKV